MAWAMTIAVITAVLAVHLGLGDAIADTVAKIAKCERCASFWLSLAILWYAEADPVTAIALSMLGAYVSHWFALLLELMQKIYTKLWQKIQK